MEAWGSGYETLRARNPDLIYCAISGWGESGPLAHQPALDGLVQAHTGFMARQAGFRPGPVYNAVPLVSTATGLIAAMGIFAGLLARERGAGGQAVSTSLLAGALALQLYSLTYTPALASSPGTMFDPLGNLPAYRVYECGDGVWIQVACAHSDFFQKLLIALDRAEVLLEERWSGAPRHFRNDTDRVALGEYLAARFQEADSKIWAHRLEQHDVPFAIVGNAGDLWRDPQARHEELISNEEHPTFGPIRRLGPLFLGRPHPAVGPSPLPALPQGSSPLAGLRIVDAGSYIAGPLAGRLLADLGADVVKVEPLRGEAYRFLPEEFLPLNHGKRSVRLDLRTEEGGEIARRLVANSDAVVHNLRPGIAERMEFGYQHLSEHNPQLVYVEISAYGMEGPYARRPGYDALAQALVGIAAEQGGEANPPSTLYVALCDAQAGLTAAAATLAGLLNRQRHNRGAHIKTSLLRAGAAFTAHRSYFRAGMEGKPASVDAGQHGTGPLHRLYRTADGWVMVAAPPNLWPRFLSSLGISGAGSTTEVEANIGGADTARVLTALRGADIACLSVRFDYDETFTSDPHAIAQGLIRSVRHPVYGEQFFVGSPVRFSRTPTSAGRLAPAAGQHTLQILKELDYSSSQIERLLARDIVGPEEAWPSP
jgi:crotonobetainyl-CoA:carnitine CoA-transferase CaiB-like acyl-CoA transferase